MKFFETWQNPNETVMLYLHRLKDTTRYCEFEKLGSREMSIEDKLILLRLIEAMYDITNIKF